MFYVLRQSLVYLHLILYFFFVSRDWIFLLTSLSMDTYWKKLQWQLEVRPWQQFQILFFFCFWQVFWDMYVCIYNICCIYVYVCTHIWLYFVYISVCPSLYIFLIIPIVRKKKSVEIFQAAEMQGSGLPVNMPEWRKGISWSPFLDCTHMSYGNHCIFLSHRFHLHWRCDPSHAHSHSVHRPFDG